MASIGPGSMRPAPLPRTRVVAAAMSTVPSPSSALPLALRHHHRMRPMPRRSTGCGAVAGGAPPTARPLSSSSRASSILGASVVGSRGAASAAAAAAVSCAAAAASASAAASAAASRAVSGVGASTSGRTGATPAARGPMSSARAARPCRATAFSSSRTSSSSSSVSTTSSSSISSPTIGISISNSSSTTSTSTTSSSSSRHNPAHRHQQQQHPLLPAAAPRAAAGPRRRLAPPPAATFAANAGDDDLLDRSSEFVEATAGWRRRWTVVLLCFVAFMLCNMDRVNMSVAVLPMSQQFSWDSRTVGLVQSSFFWGYLLTQVLGGIWADRFGGKLVLGLGVVWWSLATALTPLAAQAGLVPLLAARALMGIGEGVAMPAMNNMLSRWVPVAERSRSLALVYSGMFIGSILGLGLSPHMIAAVGWPSVFYVFGSLGIAWYVFWNGWAASTPKEDPRLSAEEKAYILANTSTAPRARAIPWRALLSRKEVWAIIVCHFCHNWGTFILLTWMPTYYNQVLGLDVMASGVFSVLPWMTMAVTANLGGWIADTLVARGASVTTVRKVMQTVGFLGPAFFLSQLSGVTDVAGAVACMMGAQGLDAFSQSGLYSNHQDIGPKYAGVLLGLSNTAGVLAGVLGSLATGHILAHGSWADVWRVAVVLYLVGTVVWNLFSTGERIFD